MDNRLNSYNYHKAIQQSLEYLLLNELDRTKGRNTSFIMTLRDALTHHNRMINHYQQLLSG